ncbi:FAD-binding domain-containing protein [Mycena olivaceomarginata]|nr:FAD-binding domain-containing protein [Mycena olivaceomarginata]
MRFLTSSLALLLCAIFGHSQEAASSKAACRNIPGSPGYPNAAAWSALNATVSGRLVTVVPSAKFCANLPGGGCTDAQWTSALFRSTIPGAMDQATPSRYYNRRHLQGYDLNPPSLCLRNATTCGQGDVPIYSVEAETVADIQAAVKFSSTHNLRVVIKSSGHDYLGRSTAPDSLLIHTHNLQDISFADSFFIGSEDVGSVVTLGSGVYSHTLYEQGKANGKIAVGGAAATVSNAGGWVQGAGHSALSPTFGLGADNALEFQVVVASGQLLQVNRISHPDLFYALRGGGAGSWGVIVSVTFRAYPTFNATSSLIVLLAQNDTVASSLAALHAEHIFDWDSVHAGQYFWAVKNASVSAFAVNTYMPNTTAAQSMALLAPFVNASLALPGVSLLVQAVHICNTVLGSRLIPAATYRDSPATVGEVYKRLFDSGATQYVSYLRFFNLASTTLRILGHLVAGGKVAENAKISSAVHPAWRTAKTHLIISQSWEDSASLAEIRKIRQFFQKVQVPILEAMTGPDAGAYSNEADLLEPAFQTTFFGPNYAKLSAIKRKYDPEDLFIVGAGVGSERWDQWGLCKI